MFDFLIFTDTTRSILSLLIFIYFTTLQNFVYKEQVRWVCSEKNVKLTKNVKSTKDIPAKSGSSLHCRNIKKNLWHI